MRLRTGGRTTHLTYCTNIHPGERWDEVRHTLDTHVTAVKQQLSPDAPFGVGLRLSAAAARDLASPEALADCQQLLRSRGLYVFTLNGFPYGSFHQTVVKEQVYRPDWLEDERVAYSDRLGEILAALLPRSPDLEGSISTVPGCFRPRAAAPGAPGVMAERIAQHAARVFRVREAGGPTLTLALEPEPECVLETTNDGRAFLEEHVFGGAGRRAFSAATGVTDSAAEEALRHHVGLCLDACHAAVEFEDPRDAPRALQAAGIRILKLQVSAGLRVPSPGPEALAALARFAEGVYLHQVVIRRGGALTRVLDLPEALSAAARTPGSITPDEEWRIHFHVPVFRETLGPFQSTQPFLRALLAEQARAPFTDHLEVETYTWDVLPEEHRREAVADAVARELRFVLGELSKAPTPS